ncbi:MAG: response regulator [Pseudomonadota bacterium]
MKRIVFVDDEQNILQGLRRMLRPMRHEWEMHFADSADAALEIMRDGEFDVVVTDMRMPGKDGAALLEIVRQEHPGTARIILSGHAEQEMAIRSVAATHQFLAKPCDAETLRNTVQRTCRLRGMLASDRLRKLTAEVGQMPSVPEVYQRISAEMGKDEPSLAEISTIVSEDLGMTAKLLQLVNSAFFGLRRHVASVDHAVAYLGMDVIRSLVLSESAFKAFDHARAGVSPDTLMRRGRRVAALAKAIARHESDNKVVADEAFQAGMMHELGKLILAAELPSEYQRVSESIAAGEAQDAAERDAFEVTQGEVGAYLLGLWGLADGIVEALAYHREPARTDVSGFAPIVAVHAAAALTSIGEPDALPLDEAWLEGIGLAESAKTWRDLASIQPNERDAA